MKENHFSFGIYPGGQLGTPAGMTSGVPDNPDMILDALDYLQGEHYTLSVRCYIIYKGRDLAPEFNPADPQRYAVNGRLLDLVLCFHSFEEGVLGWKDFIDQTIREYHPYLGKLQITEEANVNLPVLDGHYPGSRVALVEGVVYAKHILNEMGLSIPVGFNATPDFNPHKSFWKEIKSLAKPSFYHALGFVGLDFFPDVFRPLPGGGGEDALESAIRYLISQYRQTDLLQASISEKIPIHITENGWPTGAGRSQEQQEDRVEKIIRTIYALRKEFHITHYEFFALRDADSQKQDLFYQFGLLKDDYTPKKAFHLYKKLIQEMGSTAVNG
jgi:hypothetical protein